MPFIMVADFFILWSPIELAKASTMLSGSVSVKLTPILKSCGDGTGYAKGGLTWPYHGLYFAYSRNF